MGKVCNINTARRNCSPQHTDATPPTGASRVIFPRYDQIQRWKYLTFELKQTHGRICAAMGIDTHQYARLQRFVWEHDLVDAELEGYRRCEIERMFERRRAA